MLKSSKIEYRIGVDVGGTKMAAVLLCGDRVITEHSLATPKDDLEKFLVMFNALLDPLRNQAQKDKVKIIGIGVGLPGVIKNGKILTAPNLPFLNGVKIEEILKSRLEALVVTDNDANCFVRAEALLGAAKGSNRVFGLIVGTGIGGGWYVDGIVNSSEPGRMILDLNQDLTVESAYHRLTQNNPAQLAIEAQAGDVLAKASFDELGKVLGTVVANICLLLNPEVVVFGGGAIESSDLFFDEIKEVLKKFTQNQLPTDFKISKAKLGKQSGAIGAALLIK